MQLVQPLLEQSPVLSTCQKLHISYKSALLRRPHLQPLQLVRALLLPLLPVPPVVPLPPPLLPAVVTQVSAWLGALVFK